MCKQLLETDTDILHFMLGLVNYDAIYNYKEIKMIRK